MINKDSFNIDYEFKRGIFFVRLSGKLEKNYCCNYMDSLKELTEMMGLKKVVVDLDELSSIDIEGETQIKDYYNIIKNNDGKMIIYVNNFFLNDFDGQIKNVSYEKDVFAFK